MSDRALTWIHDVRGRLESPPPRRLPPDEALPAAVLVPLYIEHGRLLTLLTRRSDELPHHAGQIAFPGGRFELGEEAWAAALRESWEELGLDPRRVLKLGQLDEAASPAGFRIVPCVGAVPVPLEVDANASEIDDVFSVPLLALADPSAVEEREIEFDGRPRRVRIYRHGERQIWGVTARILQNLLQRLGLELEVSRP